MILGVLLRILLAGFLSLLLLSTATQTHPKSPTLARSQGLPEEQAAGILT